MGVWRGWWGLVGVVALGCERTPLEQAPPADPVAVAATPADGGQPADSPERNAAATPVQSGGDARLQAILDAARSGRAHERLVSLCDDVGHRLSGSAGFAQAVDWGARVFREDGVPRVSTEPVMIPRWVRGEESAWMVAPRRLELPMLGLGGSGGTPGVEAPVVVVPSVDEVDEQVRGRIVLFATEMTVEEPAYKGYGAAVGARVAGPRVASEHGAVGALVRSMTTRSLATPHTGMTAFGDAEPIPAAAITTEHADLIARLAARGVEVRVRIEMEARTEADVEGHNVVAEVPGSERPDEVVLIGAHLDSWDVGQGAQDDGAGVAHVVEAMRIIAEGPRPRRTVRAVLFANEENGLRGGTGYFDAHGEDVHVAAIESDLGGGWPIGWRATGSAEQLAWFRENASPLGVPVAEGGGGADISPLKQVGTLVVGLTPDDTHYFDVHHTEADTVDKVDAAALSEGAGALAALAWQLANAETAPGPTGEPHAD